MLPATPAWHPATITPTHAIANHLDSELPISSRYDIEDASHAMVNSHPDDCLFILQDPVEVY